MKEGRGSRVFVKAWSCFVLMALLAVAGAARAAKVEYSPLDLATVRIFSQVGVDTEEVEAKKNNRHYTLAVPIAFFGSGFLVSEDGLILTARHVVEGARQIVVRKPGSKAVFPARVVYVDDKHDFAFVSIGGKHEHFLTLPGAAPGLKVRASVFAVGYPLDPTMKRPQSTQGVVSGTLEDGTYTLGIAVNPGNSGGPLVDDAEHPLGVIVARGDPKKGVQGIGIAVPLDRPIAVFSQASERHHRVVAALSASPEGELAFSRVVATLVEGGGAAKMVEDAARTLNHLKESPLSKEMTDALALPGADPDLLALGCAYHWNGAVVRRVLEDASWQTELRVAEGLCKNAYKNDPDVAKRSPLVGHVVGVSPSGERKTGYALTTGGDLQDPTMQALAAAAGTPPRNAGGFALGDTVDATTAKCAAGKFKMTGNSDSYRCSGTPENVGAPAVARLRFCHERLCRIELIYKFEGDDGTALLSRFEDRTKTLEAALGAPSRVVHRLPTDCTESFAWCLSNQKLRLETTWAWPQTRSSVAVRMERIDGRVLVRVAYDGN